MPKIIVFHTAWMDEYDGDRASFSAGGFKYAAMHGYGHEMFNFREIDGHYYGYVPPTGNLRLEEHFDVTRDTDRLEGVTVVWTAPHPEQSGRAVVGVWRNATVYRHEQIPSGRLAERRTIEDEIAGFRCSAAAKDCVLLAPDARPIFVRQGQPRLGQSWPGQQKVFYPKPESLALQRLTEILGSIEAPGTSAPKPLSDEKGKPKRSNWQTDVERRQKIERAAVDAVGLKLERLGFEIRSVEKDNLGYDLVATRDDEVLHVEVKGRSGSDISADITANEFDCLKRYQREKNPDAHYRIAIVTDALVKPIISEFVMVRGQKPDWCTLDGKWGLKVEERTAARLTAVPTLKVEE